MTKPKSANEPSVVSLIVVPALISFAITMLRLVGELQHWSPKWFSSETGGIAPSGMSWLIGITWLAIPFGAYFGYRLAASGIGPENIRKAFICVGTGVAILLAWVCRIVPLPDVGFPSVLVFVWLVMAVAAAIQLAGWPRLVKVLLAYGLASRIPVAIIMFFAMRGNWGTHYDYVRMPSEFQMPLAPKYFWLAFFPQLVFWIGFTIVIGSLSGVITGGIMRARRVQRVQGV
jgi:hypothetical protein